MPLVLTRHYQERCALRDIPLDAAAILLRHGRARAGRRPDETIYQLGPIDALNACRHGLDLWHLVDVAVVIAEGCRAKTAMHVDAHRVVAQ